MSPRPLVVLGDTLIDVDVDGDVERICPEAPVPVLDERARHVRPGGAGLAAILAAGDGRAVTLVTALAGDEAGRELRSLLAVAGVEVVDLGLTGTTPRKTRLRADGRLVLRVDEGGAGAVRASATPETALRCVQSAAAVLVADYGRGVAADGALRRALADPPRARPVVWDPHPSGPEPVSGVDLVTPNRREAAALTSDVEGSGFSADAARARMLARRWGAEAVAVTLGAEGALLVAGEAPPLAFPAEPVAAADPCGAGDRFASAVAGSLADGVLLPDALHEAVRLASAFVRDGGAGSVRLDPPGAPPAGAPPGSAEEVVARVRSSGGTVVMAGGCFDLLHAGHVRLLQAARELGDCLVVCINSDRSVRRLKGADRPLVPQEDRAAVLGALGCVDAVVAFEEDTPAAVLERFRPDLFAKGGDYSLEQLPETEVMARWGGEVAVLPYVEGRSTTRLIEELLVRAG
jgi:rfaE bifunctional protein nucleotidyltransferase chain/domain/rfaE bifunctional protein kinase chain/domain